MKYSESEKILKYETKRQAAKNLIAFDGYKKPRAPLSKM